MSRFGIMSDICKLFCCPPVPSRIAGKLAFLPPKPPSYKIEHNELFMLAEGGVYRQRNLPQGASIHLFKSKSGNRIAAFYVQCVRRPAKFTFLWSHANALDIGQVLDFLIILARHLQCDVFIYDYSGYGASTGTPTEGNACSDATSAYEYVRNELQVPAEKLILYGQSIGSGPSVYLASRQAAAALVLHSPLLSGLRVLADVQKTYCFDIFPNIDRISKVDMPVLVIQGTDDEVINISHGRALHDAAPMYATGLSVMPLEPLWVDGAGHNDVELHEEYIERLKELVRSL